MLLLIFLEIENQHKCKCIMLTLSHMITIPSFVVVLCVMGIQYEFQAGDVDISVRLSPINPCVNMCVICLVHCLYSRLSVLIHDLIPDHTFSSQVFVRYLRAVRPCSNCSIVSISEKTSELSRVEVMFNVGEESNGKISSEMRATGRPQPLQRN